MPLGQDSRLRVARQLFCHYNRNGIAAAGFKVTFGECNKSRTGCFLVEVWREAHGDLLRLWFFASLLHEVVFAAAVNHCSSSFLLAAPILGVEEIAVRELWTQIWLFLSPDW